MVFTDINKDHNTSILQRAILDGHVDSGLLSFIEDINDNKQYTMYKQINLMAILLITLMILLLNL